MATTLLGMELETGGVLLKFTQTTVETAGALHIQEATYPPHSTVPPMHRHPKQTERFVVHQGALQFVVGGEPRRVSAGDELVIDKSVLHCAYNPGDAPALVTWETRPALRTGELFVALARASRGRKRPPLTEAAAIMREFRDEFELGKPPLFIQRVVFGCLAPFGRGALRPVTQLP